MQINNNNIYTLHLIIIQICVNVFYNSFDTSTFIPTQSFLLPQLTRAQLSFNTPPDLLLLSSDTPQTAALSQSFLTDLSFFTTCLCSFHYRTSRFPSSCQASLLSKFKTRGSCTS